MIYYAIRQQIKYNGAHSRWTYLHYSVNIGYTNVSKRCRTLLDVDVDVEEIRAQTIVSMPVINIQFLITIL